jgi:hypothetical protein
MLDPPADVILEIHPALKESYGCTKSIRFPAGRPGATLPCRNNSVLTTHPKVKA